MSTAPTTVDIETADIGEIIEGVSGFLRSVVEPLEWKHEAALSDPRLLFDVDGRYCVAVREAKRSVRMASAEAGYYTLFAPEELGGAGLGNKAHYLLWEWLFRNCGPSRILAFDSIGHWATGPTRNLLGLQEQPRVEVLPRVMSGECSLCFAMSEPDAGSDVRSMRTTAIRDGDDWIINGTKQWITNSPVADYVLLIAVTDREQIREGRRGLSCFLVPTDAPGFSFDSVINLFGRVGGNEGIISFQDVRVPETYRVGELHNGLALAMTAVSQGRMYNAGRAVGVAQWALAKAAGYAKQRSTFGTPIADHQAIQFKLAESAMELYPARCASLDCAERLDRGEDASTELTIVKAVTTETSLAVVDRAMQVHGGMGFTSEVGLYAAWHMCRISLVSDGTAEILRRNIGQSILKRGWLGAPSMIGSP